MTDMKAPVERPLSPHLQIYGFSWTMAMSIIHRMTGIALYLGTLMIAIWLMGTASGRSSFASVQWIMGSILGQLVLFGYTWALLHHMLGGIRHFIWDTGAGYGKEASRNLARFSLVASVALTILVWAVAIYLR